MGGTAGQSVKIDRNISRDAEQFLKRLTNDMVLQGDENTLHEVIDRLFEKKSDGSSDLSIGSREAAANKLINSLTELDRNRDNRTAEQQARWNEATGIIGSFFTDLDLDSPKEIADAIKAHEINAHAQDNADKNARRMDILSMLDQSGAKLGVQFSQDQLAELQRALNQISPGLGDVMAGIIDLATGGLNHLTENERTVHNRFESAFEAMAGGPSDLAHFLDVEQRKGLDGKPEHFNSMIESRSSRWGEFFGDGVKAGGTDRLARYEFYDNDGTVGSDGKPGLLVDFEDMILKPLEDEGLIEFTSSEARADFIEEVVNNENYSPNLHGAELIAQKIEAYARNPANGLGIKEGGLDDIQAAVHDLTQVTNARDFAARWMEYAEKAGNGVVLNMATAHEVKPAPATVASAAVAGGAGGGGAALPPEDYVRLALKMNSGNVTYGDEIVTVSDVNFDKISFADNMTVYRMEAGGNLEVQAGPGGNLEISSDSLRDILGGDFKIQSYASGGHVAGYFVHNEDGEGFYLGIEAVDRDEMNPEIIESLFPKATDSVSGPASSSSFAPSSGPAPV